MEKWIKICDGGDWVRDRLIMESSQMPLMPGLESLTRSTR